MIPISIEAGLEAILSQAAEIMKNGEHAEYAAAKEISRRVSQLKESIPMEIAKAESKGRRNQEHWLENQEGV